MSHSVIYLTKRAAWNRVYTFDFSGFAEVVGGETLSSPVVTSAPSGLTVGSPSISSGTVRVRISSGTADVSYLLSCAVTTSGGSTLSLDGGLVVTS